jgi:hypothetical protein
MQLKQHALSLNLPHGQTCICETTAHAEQQDGKCR